MYAFAITFSECDIALRISELNRLISYVLNCYCDIINTENIILILLFVPIPQSDYLLIFRLLINVGSQDINMEVKCQLLKEK